jgi:hypothetical protein
MGSPGGQRQGRSGRDASTGFSSSSRGRRVVDGRQHQALAAHVGPLLHHLGGAHAARGQPSPGAHWRRLGVAKPPSDRPGSSCGIGQRLEGDADLAQLALLAADVLGVGVLAHVDDPAAGSVTGSSVQLPPGQPSSDLAHRTALSSKGPACRHSGGRGPAPSAWIRLTRRRQDAHRLRPDLLRQALRLRLLHRRPAPGQQQPSRPGVVAAVGQQQQQDDRRAAWGWERDQAGRTLTSELVTACMPAAVCTSRRRRRARPGPCRQCRR